jgi:hypothetical protein
MSKISYNRNMHQLVNIDPLYLRKVQPPEGINGRYFSIEPGHHRLQSTLPRYLRGGEGILTGQRVERVTRMVAKTGLREEHSDLVADPQMHQTIMAAASFRMNCRAHG